MQRLSTTQDDFWQHLDEATRHASQAALDEEVQHLYGLVQEQGDAALLELTRRWDHLEASSVLDLEIPRTDWQQALDTLPTEQATALRLAQQRIAAYAEYQRLQGWQATDSLGVTYGEFIRPVDRAGVYAPGGRAAYASTVLMNVIPARVAGVQEIIVCSPAPHGQRHQAILAACALAGAHRLFTLGGAQAILAMGLGTTTMPRCDVVVGPGNRHVVAAKRLLAGTVGIDSLAGPSEVVLIADDSALAERLAWDLLAQAEHDEAARCVLISPSAALLDTTCELLHTLLRGLPRQAIAEQALAQHGLLIHCRDLDEAVALANHLAPEHLGLAVSNPEHLLDAVRHAGTVVLGHHACEALSDYLAGPNHVLPTAGAARHSSPLGVYTFQKRSSLLMATSRAAETLASPGAILARTEGLEAHARALEVRKKESI